MSPVFNWVLIRKKVCLFKDVNLELCFYPYLAPEILNTIKWSEALDEVFRNNSKEDPGLKWQYFGSETGVLRSFPGILSIIFPSSFTLISSNSLVYCILITVYEL